MTRHPHLLCTALAACALSLPAAAQDHQHSGDPERLGGVTFPSSCSAAAQPLVQRGVAMLHSFWFDQAQRTFEQAAAADSGCAMAHWGVAMTQLGNPFTAVDPPPARRATALGHARAAVASARGATPREQGFAEAALALYQDHETVGYRARMQAHEAAMLRLRDAQPADPEAAIFYARAVIANAPPSDLTFARQKVASAILDSLFRAHPDHPGLAHYIIHANDAPPMAQQGLDAARRYAGIAPSAPHALHMPSHIFTRLGYWQESVDTNRRSAAAEPDSNAAVHPMDYMVYAYLQQGRDADARRVVDRAVQNADAFYGSSIIGYNFAAMPARYALERGQWGEAAALRIPSGMPPHVEAITRFARGVGAARAGQAAAARDEVAALAALRDSLAARRDAYWATIVGAQKLAAEAWLAHAEGDDPRAVRLAREAAELEETVEKHPVTPGPLLPARELEADLLLELGRPAEARAAYEKTLQREPRRARALFGAGRAAELAGDPAGARGHYQALLEVMGAADAGRREPAQARAFLGRAD
ncbi:MAG TPA: tetratricopeptide repeat protein [Longimicrobiaceae bacterium]|nr:tetratricopeptide repeat protein [Longimicrobiaceae bacterium]